ncbi:hypothetical protein FNV43_RR22274 [Rhamnella rubrinervis]|uniref:Basic blue protein n=1 Tax=Rhamnella rubrinervis TaxID=2594499 RepID=A0A8K0E1P1_9ROSA|nr:hypothetical protein FNV43_RR22274 [Rhamnella rubrinervis]
MGQERGSAMAVYALLVLFSLLLSHSAHAATHIVGDTGGWTFNVAAWPRGKHFRAGDRLLFRYGAGVHNVVAVDRAGYNACATSNGAKVYQSGRDQIKLRKGLNFFICNFAGHCQSGMRIAVNAY